MSTTTTELQAIWDKASAHLSSHTIANEQNGELVIPIYDEQYLRRLSKHVSLTAKLPVLLEQLLQTYLTHNDTPCKLHVLILCDLALAISLRIVHENTSTLCRGRHCDNKLCEHELCLLLITLCDTFCHYLLADELAVIVFYLRQRTRVLCRVFERWLTALHGHQRPLAIADKNWEHSNAQKLELPVLKFCNRVLFRLNGCSNNIETRGQFLIFMANFVDIDSRSGYNLSGQFHLENVTILEAANEEHAALRYEYDVQLYHALWQLQDVFRDPRNMASPQNGTRLAQFRENLDLVLSTFNKNVIAEDEANGHFETKAQFAAVNGGASNTIGKYLTSTHLFHKQLKNPSFRRYILVQALIFIKTHQVEFPMETRPKITTLTKFAPELQKWFLEKYAEIVNTVLPSIPPHGQLFTSAVKHILQRDENWLVWKYNKKDARCQPLKLSSAHLPAIFDDNDIDNGDDAEEDEEEDDDDIDMAPAPPAAKRRKLNPQFAAFLNQHKSIHKDSMLMGDKNLNAIFKYTPAQFMSKRSHRRVNRDRKRRKTDAHAVVAVENGDGGGHGNGNAAAAAAADSLQFLHDYKLIDFGAKLQSSMERLLEEYKENLGGGGGDEQNDCENDENTHLLNDRRSIFYNLRIMRDFNHDMFSVLCPMARQPPPNTFRCDYLLDAMRFVAPNDACLTTATTTMGTPLHKQKKQKQKQTAKDKESEREIKVENDETIAHGTSMFPNGAAQSVTRADSTDQDRAKSRDRDVKMEDKDKQSTPPSIAATSVVTSNHGLAATTTNSHNVEVNGKICGKPQIIKASSSPLSSKDTCAANGHNGKHDKAVRNGHHHSSSSSSGNGHSVSNGHHVSSSSSSSVSSPSSKVISTQKKDARDEHAKMQERRKRFQMASSHSHSHSHSYSDKKVKNSSSSHRIDRSHRA